MRILYATPFLRVPPDFGAAIRNYHILEYLSGNHDVTLVTYGDAQRDETDRWLQEKKVEVVRLPFGIGWRSPWRLEPLDRMRRYPPLSFQRFAPKALARLIQERQSQGRVDALVFDTQLTGQAILHARFGAPGALVLLDLYERIQWQSMKEAGLRPFGLLYASEWLKTRFYERKVLRHFDNIVAVSADEKAILEARGHTSIKLSPNGVDIDYFAPAMPRAESETILLVGGFEYGANRDAFFYFCREVLPLIRKKRPQVRFLAVGRQPTEEMTAWASRDSNVTLTGGVPDVRPYYSESAVAVVPLRVGGGVKLKTLEAFAMGVPVVSTTFGCEGIAAREGEHLRVADRPGDFAEMVLNLLEHPERRRAMARRARLLVEERYDWKQIARDFEGYLMGIASGGAGTRGMRPAV